MALFTADDYGRLDWRLLQNGSVNLYWRPEILSEDVAWLEAQSYLIKSFDCTGWTEEKTALKSFGDHLGLRDFHGNSLDALNDCLSDLAIPEESGFCVVFHRFDIPAANIPKVAHAVLDILENNSRYFLLHGRRLITLVQTDDPQLSFEPIGAVSVSWNPREWLNKTRGL